MSVGKIGNEEYDVPMYCARLWEECDFKGDYFDVCGNLDLWKYTYFNDSASSIQMGKHTKAVFYSDDGFHGDSFETTESIQCLDDRWKFNISSAQVKKFVSMTFH